MSHTKEDLKELQSKSLDEKIQISTARIIEWYEHWDGKVYVSFSGGKDSTVLLDLVRRVYPDVPAVFSDTGLEFPEIREFVKSFDNVEWVKPKMSFIQILSTYGYPIISKQISLRVHQARHSKTHDTASWKMFEGRYHSSKNNQPSCYNIPKWKFLLDSDFLIHNKCCDIMKKQPLYEFSKKTGLKPYIGVMTTESKQRQDNWMKYGCNAFEDKSHPSSTPLAFWTEQDILHYIKKYNLPYASVYGELKETNGLLYFTNYKRTGCVFCGYGCHLEKEPNRFQTLAHTHPQLYDYCMRGGRYDESGMWIPDKGLGMAKVLDYINVKWWNDGDEAKRDEYRAKYKEKEEIEHSRKKSSQTN